MKVKRMTLLAMYTTIALTIFMVESMLPTLAPVPGMKLGLANIVTLWLLYYGTWHDALPVLLMRIFLASILGGQMMSFAYSLCGGIFCFLIMTLLFHFMDKKHMVFISILGAMFHNLGQICIAALILHSLSILTYLPILTISGILAGTFTGFCAFFASKHLPRHIVWPL